MNILRFSSLAFLVLGCVCSIFPQNASALESQETLVYLQALREYRQQIHNFQLQSSNIQWAQGQIRVFLADNNVPSSDWTEWEEVADWSNFSANATNATIPIDPNLEKALHIYITAGIDQLGIAQKQLDISKIPPVGTPLQLGVTSYDIISLRNGLDELSRQISVTPLSSQQLVNRVKKIEEIQGEVRATLLRSSTVFLTDYARRILEFSEMKKVALQTSILSTQKNGKDAEAMQYILQEMEAILMSAHDEFDRAMRVFSSLNSSANMQTTISQGRQHLENVHTDLQQFEQEYRYARIQMGK